MTCLISGTLAVRKLLIAWWLWCSEVWANSATNRFKTKMTAIQYSLTKRENSSYTYSVQLSPSTTDKPKAMACSCPLRLEHHGYFKGHVLSSIERSVYPFSEKPKSKDSHFVFQKRSSQEKQGITSKRGAPHATKRLFSSPELEKTIAKTIFKTKSNEDY